MLVGEGEDLGGRGREAVRGIEEVSLAEDSCVIELSVAVEVKPSDAEIGGGRLAVEGGGRVAGDSCVVVFSVAIEVKSSNASLTNDAETAANELMAL